MWECPKCGRKFKRANQDHYCGAAPQSIAEYIARQPEEVQPYLFQIDEAIRSALPDTMQKDFLEYADVLEKAEPNPVCGLSKAHWPVSRPGSGGGFRATAARVQNKQGRHPVPL